LKDAKSGQGHALTLNLTLKCPQKHATPDSYSSASGVYGQGGECEGSMRGHEGV